MSKFLFVLITLASAFAFAGASKKDCLQRIAAFDIGSGTTKYQVADINTCEKKISQVHLKNSFPVGFKSDLQMSSDKKFSPEILKTFEQEFLKHQTQILDLKPDQMLGVATQAFREALNAEEVLQKIKDQFKIQVKIISQKEEGELGFLSVQTLLKLQKNEILIWDIGGGSQQLTYMEQEQLKVIESKVASVTFKEAVIENVLIKDSKKTKSPNPLTQKQIQKSTKLSHKLAQKVNQELKPILKSQQIIGIGGVFNKSLKKQIEKMNSVEIKKMSIFDLSKLAQSKVNLTDEQIGGDYSSTEITNILLVLGHMQAFGIKELTPVDFDLTEGVLVQQFN